MTLRGNRESKKSGGGYRGLFSRKGWVVQRFSEFFKGNPRNHYTAEYDNSWRETKLRMEKSPPFSIGPMATTFAVNKQPILLISYFTLQQRVSHSPLLPLMLISRQTN